MKSIFFPLLLLICLLPSCTEAPNNTNTIVPSGAFFGVEPTKEPEVLLPGFISSRFGEYNGTFSPDGSSFYYTLSLPYYDVIVSTHLQPDNSWSPVEIASFSGEYSEFDPLFSPNGQQLYFSSHRPMDGGKDMIESNIWYMDKTDEGWSNPKNIPLTKQADYFSSVTNSGHIYFNAWNPDRNTDDLFRAEKTSYGYQVAALDTIVNTMQWEGDPFISPQEDYLIFRSYREEGLGRGDLYISFRKEDRWSKPQNLGAPINSTAHEMCPYVSVDGRYFVFASSRLHRPYFDDPPKNLREVAQKYDSWDNAQQNIYIMSADFIEEFRQNN